MIIKDIFSFLDAYAPFRFGMDFDNVGLLIGGMGDPVTGIVTALDITEETIAECGRTGADLIVSHHPVIFNPLKRLPSDSLVYRLIREGIGVIAAHTNLDMARGGINDALAAKLGLHDIRGFGIGVTDPADGRQLPLGRIGNLPSPMTPRQFAGHVCSILGLPAAGLAEGCQRVQVIGLCSGSGGDYLGDAAAAGAHAYVTSEMKHHQLLEAKAQGITVVDAGHYGTEILAADILAEKLGARFPDLPVHPFRGQPPMGVFIGQNS